MQLLITLLLTVCFIFHLNLSEFVWLQISNIDLCCEAEKPSITENIWQGKKLMLDKCGSVLMSLPFFTSFPTFDIYSHKKTHLSCIWKGLLWSYYYCGGRNATPIGVAMSDKRLF